MVLEAVGPMDELTLREEVIEVCRRLAAAGLVAATDGNVSCRLDERRILVTPSGVPKGDLRPLDLMVTDMDGRTLSGRGRPSSELKMHRLVYQRRGDVRAVVHAHPPLLTALTLAGEPFPAGALPEVWLGMGTVPTAPYATPSTDEVPRSIEPFVDSAQAVLLERHGSLTLGKSLMEAYLRLEKLEQAARTFILAHLLRGRPVDPLPGAALARLEEVFGRQVLETDNQG